MRSEKRIKNEKLKVKNEAYSPRFHRFSVGMCMRE